jgi:hypothetical protein
VREIRLYDSLSGEFVPVSMGDAIRVEVRGAPVVGDGAIDLESTRPLLLFSFLERFLSREGFATKFLFDGPPGGGEMLYEISEGREPLDEYDVEADVSLREVPRARVEQWVNVCFGAIRDGVAHDPPARGKPILLKKALEDYGPFAVALYLLGTHYSLPLVDAPRGLIAGLKNELRIRAAFEWLVADESSPPDMSHYMEAFRDALADDLDTPTAFVVMFEWLLEAERRDGDVGDNDLRVMLDLLDMESLAAPTGVL